MFTICEEINVMLSMEVSKEMLTFLIKAIYIRYLFDLMKSDDTNIHTRQKPVQWPHLKLCLTFCCSFNLLTAQARAARSFLWAFFRRPWCHFHADTLKILMLPDEMASSQGCPHWIIDHVVNDTVWFRLTPRWQLYSSFSYTRSRTQRHLCITWINLHSA